MHRQLNANVYSIAVHPVALQMAQTFQVQIKPINLKVNRIFKETHADNKISPIEFSSINSMCGWAVCWGVWMIVIICLHLQFNNDEADDASGELNQSSKCKANGYTRMSNWSRKKDCFLAHLEVDLNKIIENFRKFCCVFFAFTFFFENSDKIEVYSNAMHRPYVRSCLHML